MCACITIRSAPASVAQVTTMRATQTKAYQPARAASKRVALPYNHICAYKHVTVPLVHHCPMHTRTEGPAMFSRGFDVKRHRYGLCVDLVAKSVCLGIHNCTTIASYLDVIVTSAPHERHCSEELGGARQVSSHASDQHNFVDRSTILVPMLSITQGKY